MDIKRIVSLVISLALLITAIVTTSSKNVKAIAGPGGGKDEKVENIEEVITVLSCFLNDGEYSLTDPSSAMMLSTSNMGDLAQAISHELNVNGHESATITISNRLNSSSSYSGNGSHYTQKATMTRAMTMYITEDETYYESKGEFFVSYDGSDDEPTTNFYKFNMLIYVEDDTTYACFRELLMVDPSQTVQIKAENIGRWVELPPEAFEELVDIDDVNREMFASIADLLNVLISIGEITTEDKSVSVNSSDWERIKNDYEDEMPSTQFEDFEVDFDVDLSLATQPYLAIVATMDDEQELQGQRATNKVTEDIRITMRNIDNTVIDFDEDMVSLVCYDEADLNSIVIIKEIEKETEEEDERS